MNDYDKVFEAGTIARCNRCNQPSPLPKECKGRKEGSRAYRLITMATLECGHMDAHWVYVKPSQEVNA